MTNTNVAVVAQEQVIVVDELVSEGKYGIYRTNEIRISTTNRTRFNEEALNNLAASIKEKGVIQPILIRPVTPTIDEPQIYEIVAGERRWRASSIAGIATIPAVCKTLTDLQAAEIQILENLQREDPHPLEEAEGYQRLMMNHGYDADTLADKIKKSRSYIYGSLKLCALAAPVREHFLNDDKFNKSVALLIARIPVPELQIQAMKEIQSPLGITSSEPMSYRKAVEHVQNRYMLDLTLAPFSLTDGKLLASAGSCAKCPKRTGNQPVIFDDVKNADVCSDPDCFAEKKAAHSAKLVAMAYKTGIPVHEGEEGNKHLQGDDIVDGTTRAWYFEGVKGDHNVTYKRIEDLLPAAALPKPTAYVKLDNGEIKATYDKSAMQTALEKAGICTTEEEREQEERTEKQAEANRPKPKQDVEREERQQRADVETKFRVALYKKVRATGASGFGEGALRAIVKLMLDDFAFPSDLLGECYPENLGSDDQVRDYIDRASVSEVQLLMVDMLISPVLEIGYWDVDRKPEESEGYQALLNMATHAGIDPRQMRQELEKPTPAPKTAKSRKTKATLVNAEDTSASAESATI